MFPLGPVRPPSSPNLLRAALGVEELDLVSETAGQPSPRRNQHSQGDGERRFPSWSAGEGDSGLETKALGCRLGPTVP